MAEPIISDLAHRTRFSALNKVQLFFRTVDTCGAAAQVILCDGPGRR